MGSLKKLPITAQDFNMKGKTGKKEIKSKDDVESGRDVRKMYFEKENRGFFLFFIFSGLYAVRNVKGKYVVSKIRFILFYLTWITYPLAGLILASQAAHWMNSSEVELSSFMEDTLTVLILAVIPSLQAYSLKFITKSLPEILETISELSLMEVGFATPMKILEDLSEKACKLKAVTENKQLHPNRLFNWLPRAMVLFSMAIFFAVCSMEYLHEINLQTLDSELPCLVILFVFLTFPFLTSILIAVFTWWLRRVYRALYLHCKEVMPSCNMDQVLAICSYVDMLQRLFVLLDEGFFRYTLTMNSVCMTIGASLCTARLLQGYTQIVYIGPLVLHCITLGISCEVGELLVAQVRKGLLYACEEEVRLLCGEPIGR